MKIYQKIILILIPAMLLFGCKKEDFKGHSSQTPTSPTITVDVSEVPGAAVSDLTKTSYTITLNMDVTQIVDVKVYVTLKDEATATEGDDFSFDGSVVIPAGRKSGTLNVTINSDELLEENETFTLIIGDERTANATITAKEVTFTISNGTEDYLASDLTWTTNVLDVVGMDLAPDEVVDLRFLITDEDGNIITGADGASFESYNGYDTLDDGAYKIAVDIYSTINAGDFDGEIDLSLELEFNQLGIINGQVLSFPAVMTNRFSCSSYRTYLATLTKAGSTYTIEEAVSYLGPDETNWFGEDALYESQVYTVESCNDDLMYGINAEWMFDFWGEEIIYDRGIIYTIDEFDSIRVADQFIFTTLYDGAEYPYDIVDFKGVYDDSEAFPTMTFTYELNQDGTDIAALCYDYGLLDTTFFADTLTLDPAGKNIIKSTFSRSKLNRAMINR